MTLQNVQVGAANPAGASLHQHLVRSEAGYQASSINSGALTERMTAAFTKPIVPAATCAGQHEFNDQHRLVIAESVAVGI